MTLEDGRSHEMAGLPWLWNCSSNRCDWDHRAWMAQKPSRMALCAPFALIPGPAGIPWGVMWVENRGSTALC